MLAFPEYHSPSSLRMWRNAPRKWCLQYLYEWRDDGHPKMWRGWAVEDGFAAYLTGEPFERAMEHAARTYQNKAKDKTPEGLEEQWALVDPMLRQLIAWHEKNPWKMAKRSQQIWTELPHVKCPLMGYLDIEWTHEMDTDIKSTEACPQKGPRDDDLRQVSIYGQARGRPQSILYVTDKKTKLFTPSQDDMEAAAAEVAQAARSLELFLTLMPDRDSAIRCLAGNDHFSFDDAAKAKLAELGV